ncbi:MAG: urea ABC transporter ATP-binding subunit UrtE [Gammaproteobacteria bacterium]|nr:urea ABC transporter ATP-binding subunit UrtE [Gammaproteobacteria bacterium]
MLKLKQVNQFYGQSHTLWDIDMQFNAGKISCVMGRNGVGKSTLMKTIMGLTPARGEIILNDVNLLSRKSQDRAHLGIGYVPQGRDIFSQLTVQENLEIGLFARKDKAKRIPEKIFTLFPVLKEMLHRRGGDLSGGQQQQLAIGRALCTDPNILILDEPGEGIQPNIVQLIGEVLVSLAKEENFTIILVEQKLPFARKFADEFTILDRGRVVAKDDISGLSDAVVKRYLSV